MLTKDADFEFIDVSKLASGVFFVNILSENGTIIQQLVFFFSLFTIHYSLFTIHYSLFTTFFFFLIPLPEISIPSLPLFICIAFIPKVNDGEKSDTTNYKQNRI
ncbi:MAG: hypothetical protein ACI9HJ_000780 [Ulvibacter sp.]